MGAKENFTHNLKKAMRQHEFDRHMTQQSLESLIADLEYYYEEDINNCTMTNKDWIEELAKAMTYQNYKQDFQEELKEYQESREVRHFKPNEGLYF